MLHISNRQQKIMAVAGSDAACPKILRGQFNDLYDP
jgi:hypothetical protein